MRYIDDTKSRSALTSFGLQLPTEKSGSGLDGNVILQSLFVNNHFNTDNIRFSLAANIGNAIKNVVGKDADLRNTARDWKAMAKGRWSDSLGLRLQFLGRRQITDIYGKGLEGLNEYEEISCRAAASFY